MLKELIQERDAVEAEINAIMSQARSLTSKVEAINAEIDAVIGDRVKEARQLTNKPTGTVDVLVDGVMVKHCVQKRVAWNQAKLAEIRQRIIDGQDNPENYMDAKTTYSVKEKAFKAFPAPIKAIFEDAREIKIGKPSVAFDMDWR